MTPRLTVLHRADCELCDRMIEELAELARSHPLPPVELQDVDADPVTARRHGLHVPVLLLDGTVVCRHRLDREELLRLLRPNGPAPAPL